MKHRWFLVGKVACVLLAAGWLLSLNGCNRWADDTEDEIEGRDSTARSINGLRPEDQTPRYRPAPDASEAVSEDGGAPALQQKESGDFQPAYDFKTWEDALGSIRASGRHRIRPDHERRSAKRVA